MTVHFISPERRTLHGSFSRDYEPILTIDPGDTVRYKTLDAGWGLEPPKGEGHPGKHFEPRDPERDSGHAMCGPIAIRGAKPGMTLAVQINALQPGSWGWSSAGGWPLWVNDRLGISEAQEVKANWRLDADAMVGRNQRGETVPLRPFMGLLGMPPGEPGIHSSRPPRFCGGNLDCKELVPGSILYLPIPVEGALFSIGDGHAAQGDGEVSGVAIECPMDLVDITLDLRPNMELKMPRAKTPAGWIAFGLHEDLNEAFVIALEGMLDLMGSVYGLSQVEALNLASLVVDFRITQVVNVVRGVHAVLPHGVISQSHEAG